MLAEEGSLANRIISIAGSSANEARVYEEPLVGASAELLGASARDEAEGASAAAFFCGGGFSVGFSSGSFSSLNISSASLTFCLSISLLNKHIALSLLERLMRRSVTAVALSKEGSSPETAVRSRSLSPEALVDPDGEDVLGGSEIEPEIERGVEGCSGADAVAMRA